ncbi:hypothetical protein EV379_1253 [Microterricola gilva]|uniref:ReqiPepy6 Gp37-like protein n=1 Tax=Microterricola gilva TaxID=393267 RepID=A0A4Q8AKA8_9MICO|nr:hypothetical protein [Microterricola gilva]RZU64942.1 hypothetical protein EV379_1253 [Microterricola gilva]
MWSFGIFDALTGNSVDDVFPAAGNWRTSSTAIGSGQHKFHLRDAATRVPQSVARNLFADWSRVLVVMDGGVPVYAGIILKTEYDKDTGVLTVEHSELRLIYSKRHVYGVDEYNSTAQIQVVGKSPKGLLLAVIKAASYRPVPGNWTLPMRFPADEAGGVSKTWFHYQLMKAEDMITEVGRMAGAVDFYLQPKLDANGRLFWDVILGSPRLPGATIDAPTTVPEPIITGLREVRDAARRLTGVLMVGKGSEMDIRVGKAGATVAPTIPYLDDSRSAKATDNQFELNALATSEMGVHEFPVAQYEFKLTHTRDADGSELFKLSDCVPGARVLVETRDDEWLYDGQKTFYVLGVSGDMSRTVTPEVQEL